jgi:AbiTii
MNLVNELQQSAVSDDVFVVLRNTMRLASKLNRTDIGEWLSAELSGYKSDQTLPPYRVVDAIIGFRTTGPSSPGFGFDAGSITPLPPVRVIQFPIVDSISTITQVINDLIGNNDKCLCCSAEEGSASREVIRPHIAEIDGPLAQHITFLVSLNHRQIRAIPDRIKDTILRWALDLEAAGVKGDGISFSEEERRISQTVIFNINRSIVGQLTTSGTNQQG